MSYFATLLSLISLVLGKSLGLGKFHWHNSNLKIEDSGWITIDFEYPFYLYIDGSAIRYRKYGSIIELCGIITTLETIGGSSTLHTICTMPSGYRPKNRLVQICQGSSSANWTLEVSTAGVVSFSRYTIGDSFSDTPDGVWLPFDILYMIP